MHAADRYVGMDRTEINPPREKMAPRRSCAVMGPHTTTTYDWSENRCSCPRANITPVRWCNLFRWFAGNRKKQLS